MPASELAPAARQDGLGFPVCGALALLSAVLFLATVAPMFVWPLAFLVPVPLAWMAIRARTTRGALSAAALVYIPTWLWLERWLIDVTLPGYPLLAIYDAAYAVLFTWLVRRFAHRRRTATVPMTVLVPVAWVGLEFVRGEIIFGGYAWYLLGHPLIDRPEFVQSVDLLGMYVVSFLVAAVAGFVIDLDRRRPGAITRRAVTVCGVVLGVAHVANIGYGWWRVGQTDGLRPGPTLLVIQTNLPQSNKIGWTLEDQVRDVAGFVELTREAWNETGGRANAVVWPETMLPVRGLEPEIVSLLEQFGQAEEVAMVRGAYDLAASLNVPLVVGSLYHTGLTADLERQRWVWDAYYNSAYRLGPDRSVQRYDKMHLTPFGEVMPYLSAWPWLVEKLLAIGAPGMTFSMDAARHPRRLSIGAGAAEVTFGTPICFEDAVAGVCRRMVFEDGAKRASMLVNLSNDGWFGRHDGGRMQHVHSARFRCIENRVPMIRCANTGLSVSIDSVGRVVGTIGAGRYGEPQRSGWLEAPVTLDDRRPLAARMGAAWPMVCFVTMIGLVVLSSRRFSRG